MLQAHHAPPREQGITALPLPGPWDLPLSLLGRRVGTVLGTRMPVGSHPSSLALPEASRAGLDASGRESLHRPGEWGVQGPSGDTHLLLPPLPAGLLGHDPDLGTASCLQS